MSDASARAEAAISPFGERPAILNLEARSIGGGIAVFLANGGNRVIRVASILLLARMLTPGDFGVFAIVSTFVGIAGLLCELGLATATVQRSVITTGQVSTLFWINVVAGALMTLAGLLGAPLLGLLYEDARVEAMCLLLSLSPLLGALGVQHLALLQRSMRYRELALIGVLSVALGNAAAVTAAFHGHAFASLAIGFLVSRLVTTLFAWLACRWRPGRPQPDAVVAEMLRFGGYLVGFGLLGLVGTGLHNVLLGLAAGAEGAGLYYRAYSFVQLAQGMILDALAVVAVVALSHVKDQPEEFRRQYLGYARVVCTLCAPLGAFGCVFASDLIPLLFGAQWTESAPLFAVLSLGIVFYALAYSTGWIYISTGNTRRMMQWGLIGWTLVITGTLVGVPLGLQGLAVAQALTTALVFIPCMPLAFRGTPLTMRALLENAWRPVLAATAAALAVHLALQAMLPAPGLARLVIGAALFGGLYFYLLSEPLGQRAELVQFAKDVTGRFRRRLVSA